MIQHSIEKKTTYEIFVPSSMSFHVHANGERVANWQALQEEARQAVEPELRRRWEDYRAELVAIAIKAAQSGAIEDLMVFHATPDMHYACPDWLAAKADL